MEALQLGLMILAAVLLSSVIDQLVPKVSSPLIQIGLGVLIALLAVSPIAISIDPELFIVLFIVPLIFDESKNIDKAALWKNRRPVISLAIGLVLAAALAVGFYVNWLIPSIPLMAAFALGAALGPTDAIAVSSLSKDINVNRQQRNVLEAESLINDASGIVSFQFAIAAAVTGAFSLFDASTSFLFSFFGGILVGIVLGYFANFIIRRVRAWGLENTTFHVLFEVFIPFIVYLVANTLGTSGILAVVAAGLIGIITPRTLNPQASRLNIVSN
ncbi:MAG: sodium:proton antiporter, partial [Raoultibacter sp.]